MSGGTPEAEELAHYLRDLTGGWTTRALQAQFGQGRTQWSEFLRGSKLIPLWLLRNVVTELVDGPIREAKFQQGCELLEAAEAAAAKASPTTRPTGSQAELELRLDDARKAQIEAQQTLMGTNQLVIMLLEMVASLQRRCVRLEHERDQALAEHSSSAPSIKKEIAETESRIVATEERLQRAREEREEAEDLRVTTHRVAEEHRIALEEMQRKAAQDSPAETETPGGNDTAEEARSLWEYDRALEVADEQLNAHRRQMDRLWEEVGTSDPQDDETQQVIRGEVVHQDSADNPSPQRETTQQQRSEEGRPEDDGPGPAGPLHVFDTHRRQLNRLWDEAGTSDPQEDGTQQVINGGVVHQDSADNVRHPPDRQSVPDLVRAVSSPERDDSQLREQALQRSPAQFVELYMRVSESEQLVMRDVLEERTSGDRTAITILLRDAIHHRRRLPPSRPSTDQQDQAPSALIRKPEMIEVRCWSCARPAQVNRERFLQLGYWSCTQCGVANNLPR